MALPNNPTKSELIQLINDKLQDNTSISAAEHREVETALVNAIYEYSVQLGDIKEIAIANLNDFETSGANIGRGKVGTMRYGWAICNGYNGTVDKSGRVTTGINTSSGGGSSLKPLWNKDVKYTGGYELVTLTLSQIPSHTHNGHVIKASSNWSGGGRDSGDNATSTTGATEAAGGNAVGGTDGHNNCQPYVVGVFVQKIAENY